MELSVFLEQILFVIVLYKQKPEQSPTFKAILDLNGKAPISIFVYDNSPEPQFVNSPSIFYHHDSENSGVAKAYNEASLKAEELKKKWMMLLDQDTHITFDFLTKLAETVQPNKTSVAFVPILTDEFSAVSPFRWSLGRGVRIATKENRLTLKKFRFLNSGLLIRLDAFQNSGGYLETIPLYFSDIAIGEQLQKVTDHFIVVPVQVRHSLSATEKISREAALHRYNYFCQGAFAMGETFGAFYLYFFRAFLRGLNLSAHYKNPIFLKTFFAALR